MKLSLVLDGTQCVVELAKAKAISIPIDFNGAQPNHFGAEPATRRPLAAGPFIGDTRQGGSCNVDIIELIPHCNGTHTESVGHIVDQVVPIANVAPLQLLPAKLISVEPAPASDSGETYRPVAAPQDRVLTRQSLAQRFQDVAGPAPSALVVRTLPNSVAKTTTRYRGDDPPPFFTIEAMEWLDENQIDHLLVDVPSIDRMHDDGLLTNHHLFWKVPEGTHTLTENCQQTKTITEMVYVADDIPDGSYFCSLQVPSFLTDAAPSRPVLYPLEVAQ